jgi:hypothetical protein
MSKQQRHEKRKPQPKVEPRGANYTIADNDVWGVEFDAKFRGQENYSRLFYGPTSDKLYLWKIDRRPEKFVKIPTASISVKRKGALLEVWEKQPSDALETA